MDVMVATIVAFLALIAGAAIGYFVNRYQMQTTGKVARLEAERLVEEANTQAREIVLAAKDEELRLREKAEADTKRMRANLQQEEERLQKRRETIDRKVEQLERRDRQQNQRQSRLDKLQNELDNLQQQRLAELEKIAAMSRDEAKELLLQAVEEDTRQDMARVIREVEAETKEKANAIARELIADSIQRLGNEQVAEIVVSSVPLPNDEMKGRIIGRGGRNIRAFEQASGVDVVVDDTPEAVIISSFDPVRRETARVAMNKLILDGRIHPARIEKIIADSRKEVEAVIREEGERAVYEVGVHGLHPEIIKVLGRLHFRTSYGQNQLAHAVECARLAGMLASELGANVKVAKAGALLHDIGKALDHEHEGTHSQIGADLCRRHRVPPEVIHCIIAHHHEEEPQTVEAVIVEAADAISGARPGARRESLENYLKRVSELEDLASSFKGVAESYAIQAGREVRIVVKPEDIDDLGTIRLSKEIAQKIEETMQYPGQIKVLVIRETRSVDFAK
jgi:ribonuclease Y